MVGLTGCGGPGADTVTVFAASSLTGVMEPLTEQYAQEHPGTDFSINFGSSAQLVQQIRAGARAEVLITADERATESLAGSDLLGSEPMIIATNPITLALAPGNPANIGSLADLRRAGVTIARCAPAVPCGRATDRVLEAMEVELVGMSAENNVRSVLTKVAAGQVDAGFVYATDVDAAQSQGVRSLQLPDMAPNRYPATLLSAGADDEAAAGFQQWLGSAEAAQILRTAGFGPPEGDHE